MKFLRNVVILLSSVLIVFYAVALVFLYTYQRDLLFPRTEVVTDAPPSGSIYRAREIVERDGTRLTVWQSPPAQRELGTFVMFYGNASSVLEFAQAGESIHRDGFGVVLASYRGYSGNTGSPNEAGLMADARAVLAKISPQDGPIILWGHSLGSGVAARMASEGRGSGLILESPFTTAVDVAAGAYPIFPVRWLMKDHFDTLSLISRIKIPILILHGTDDKAVPFKMSAILAKAFGSRATLVPIPGAGHNLDPLELLPPVRAWLHRNLTAIYRAKPAPQT